MIGYFIFKFSSNVEKISEKKLTKTNEKIDAKKEEECKVITVDSDKSSASIESLSPPPKSRLRSKVVVVSSKKVIS